jgi:hypothetical protein
VAATSTPGPNPAAPSPATLSTRTMSARTTSTALTVSEAGRVRVVRVHDEHARAERGRDE